MFNRELDEQEMKKIATELYQQEVLLSFHTKGDEINEVRVKGPTVCLTAALLTLTEKVAREIFDMSIEEYVTKYMLPAINIRNNILSNNALMEEAIKTLRGM